MTDGQKKVILQLRNSGCGYKMIAATLEVPRDSVRNYCKSQGLGGYGVDIIKGKRVISLSERFCRQCGTEIVNSKNGRKRKYCTPICKAEWEKAHPKMYSHECQYCGISFKSKSSKQEFCSQDCYIKNRFWRTEDMNVIVQRIEAGDQSIKAPQWLKNMLK